MKNNKYMATCARLTTVLLVIFTTGCMSFSDRHFRPVKDSLAQQMPDIRLDKEMAFSASSGLINLIDILGGNEVDLDDLNRVRIAVRANLGFNAFAPRITPGGHSAYRRLPTKRVHEGRDEGHVGDQEDLSR